VVARDLLGRLLGRRLPEGLVAGRIVECEAYEEGDPASHSFRGLTERTAVMFGPAGHLYVYFTYGMHFCMNVVTGRDGEGSAVLLRAVEPVQGIDVMRDRRGVSEVRRLCAGPGRLTQAYGVTRAENGLDLVSGGDLVVGVGDPIGEAALRTGPRVGISVAVEKPWRFYVAGSPFVSRRSWPKRRGETPRVPAIRARATEKVMVTGKARARARVRVRAQANRTATASGSAREAGSQRPPSG
jgi:DNA-3-methyladenine glycosylase